MSENWPFTDPENTAVLTLKQIVRGEAPILRVTHDEDDGGWQFVDGGEVSTENSALVSLQEVIRIDPSLLELANLPLGWTASRARLDGPWQWTPAATEEDWDRRLSSDIEELGWRLVVAPAGHARPAFAYSIGLTQSFGHPEVVVFGSDSAFLGRVIDRLGEQVRAGRRLLDGEPVSGIIEHYDIQLDEVPRHSFCEDKRFGALCRFYGDKSFTLMQGYWADYSNCCP